MKTIAIIGASQDRAKFGNRAVRVYAAKGYRVYPVHPTATEIEGLAAYPSINAVPETSLDCISVYLPPEIGLQIIGDIAKKGASEVWLNPGAESHALVAAAQRLGLKVIQACSIIAVGGNPNT